MTTLSACRVVAELKKAGIPHFTHLYVEGTKAPASAVVDIIEKVAKAEKADLIILSRSNKVRSRELSSGSLVSGRPAMPPAYKRLASRFPSCTLGGVCHFAYACLLLVLITGPYSVSNLPGLKP